VAQYLNRRRNDVARRVGDTFGDVTDFARRQSLFTPGATDDRHFVGVIFARIGNIVTHGVNSSAAPAAANERTPINMRNRRRANAPTDRTRLLLVLTSLHLLSMFANNTAAMGNTMVFYQDDTILPYYVGGTSDVAQHFYPVTLSVMSHEDEVWTLKNFRI